VNPTLCQTQLVIVGATEMVDGYALAVFCLGAYTGAVPDAELLTSARLLLFACSCAFSDSAALPLR
jgi:hypothetical protein